MASLMSVTKTTSKIIPASKGILQNVVTGVGADLTMRTVDNLFGSPVQRIASFNVPVIGNVGAIDVINYVGHAGGFKFSRKGLIAVISAKMVTGTLTSLGPIRLPGSGIVSTGPATASSGPTASAPGGASF